MDIVFFYMRVLFDHFYFKENKIYIKGHEKCCS